jgi:lysine/ornithine N-monooxygenase
MQIASSLYDAVTGEFTITISTQRNVVAAPLDMQVTISATGYNNTTISIKQDIKDTVAPKLVSGATTVNAKQWVAPMVNTMTWTLTMDESLASVTVG